MWVLLAIAGCNIGLDPLQGTSNTYDTVDWNADTQDSAVPDYDPDAPWFMSFAAIEVQDRVSLDFETWDPDGDLEGGIMEIDTSLEVLELRIPLDLQIWTPDGASQALIDKDPCDGGQTLNLRATLTDSAGNAGPPEYADLMLSGWGARVSDNGDDMADASDIDVLELGVICGDLSAAGWESGLYTGDLDWVSFRPYLTSTWTFSLSWGVPGADYDLFLYENGGEVARSDYAVPELTETVSRYLIAGQTYTLLVAGRSGGAGAWKVTATHSN